MENFFELAVDEQSARLKSLATEALRAWGVTHCDPRLIKYRENAVFEVRTRDGARAALRVHRQGYHDAASLDSELRWMAMLARQGIAVPTPIPTEAGPVVHDGRAAGVPGVWKVDMLSWVAGRELGAVGEPLDLGGRDAATLFGAFGRTMARLHEFSSRWLEQDSQARHAWDRDGLVGERPFWGRFWELAALTPEQRDLLLQARAAIAEDLDAYGKSPANYGLIHADLVPENVMLDGDSIALIDFDDAGYGWHMFEIVTALFWLADEPEIDTMTKALLDGYRSVRPLAERDLAMTDLFVAARALTYLGWVHTRRQNETAIELTPMMIEIATGACSAYLAGRG
ncbi:MAG: phosphotransferase [Burkholderiaceae bacterium]